MAQPGWVGGEDLGANSVAITGFAEFRHPNVFNIFVLVLFLLTG
jgi:hypothetical protein